MNKVKDEMRDEYRREELGKGVRGKYLARVSQGIYLVLLEDGVDKSFPADEVVNQASLWPFALTEKTADMESLINQKNRKRTGVDHWFIQNITSIRILDILYCSDSPSTSRYAS